MSLPTEQASQPTQSSIVDKAKTFVQSVPLVTRILVAVIVAVSLLGLAVPTLSEYLSLIPSNLFLAHFYPWTIITGAIYHPFFVSALFSAIFLLIVGRLFESLWGPREFLIFIAVVTVSSGLLGALFSLFIYMVTRIESFLILELTGFNGLLSGFAVALKQRFPDQLLFNAFPLRYLPMVLFLVSLVLLFVPMTAAHALTSLPGLLAAYFYLRFVQYTPSPDGVLPGTHGDASPDFNFASCFPDALRPFITVVVERICFCGRSRQTLLPSETTTNDDAERRRNRGLRALEGRLAQLPAFSSGAAPSSPPPIIAYALPSTVGDSNAAQPDAPSKPSLPPLPPSAEPRKPEEKV